MLKDNAEENFIPLTLDGVLASTEKLLAVNRSIIPPDERDSLEYKTIYNLDDHFKERIKLDADKIRLNTLRKLNRSKSLDSIMPGAFTGYAENLIVGNQLSSPLEEINPMSLVEANRRLSQMGQGGLPSSQAISQEAHNVHPSEFGFIDTISGPECFLGDSFVFTNRGWVRWKDITNTDLLLSLEDEKQVYVKPSRLIKSHYKGTIYGFKTRFITQEVTPNHRVYFTRANYNDFRFREAQELYGKSQFNVLTGSRKGVPSQPSKVFNIPEVVRRYKGEGPKTGRLKKFDPVPMSFWLQFLGWYLSEGSLSSCRGILSTRISQVKKVNPEECKHIERVLNGCGFTWSYQESTGDFFIPGRQLAEYLQQFGKCYEKFIPEYVFSQTSENKELFIEAIMLGDGRINDSHYALTTSSKRLASDFERLCIEMGYAVNITVEVNDRKDHYLDMYVISIHKHNQRVVLPKHHYKFEYEGDVFCATVPNSVIFVKGKEGIGYWSGNSERIGVDTRLAEGAMLGDDGQIYQRFYDPKLKKYKWLSPIQTSSMIIGLPD
jgi:hypothetical protein